MCGFTGEFSFGKIDNLSPEEYNDNQMHWISLGRGDNPEFGLIDDLDPKDYDDMQMYWIALDRGENVTNILDT